MYSACSLGYAPYEEHYEQSLMELSIERLRRTNLFHEVELLDEILESGEITTYHAGDTVVRQGQYIKVLPLVLEGSIRVYQTREGREILLYYVTSHQTCMMSLSACFFNDQSPSYAVAAEKTEVLTIPTRFITQWQKKYSSWNNFVIKTFRGRYDELLNTFESVAFDHIDKRVLEYLHSRVATREGNTVEISHQQLANELGTTRVVISRILKQFEIDGQLELLRGVIKLK